MEYIQEFNDSENLGPRRVRVLVLGASGVGKSSLLNRLVRNMYFEDPNSISIIQVAPPKEETYHMQIYNGDHCAIHLEFTDSSSIYISVAMRRIAITTSQVFVVVYSTSDPNSFHEALRICEEIIIQRGKNDPPILLVGNKKDLSSELEGTSQTVPLDKVKERIRPFGVRAVEVSAKDALNMEQVVQEILRLCDATPDLFIKNRQRVMWMDHFMDFICCCFPQFMPQTA